MVDGKKLNYLLEFNYLGSTISSKGCIDGTTIMGPCGVKARYILCNRAVHPPVWSRGLDSVQMTGDKAAWLHGATSAFEHEDNLDEQSDNQGHTRVYTS